MLAENERAARRKRRPPERERTASFGCVYPARERASFPRDVRMRARSNTPRVSLGIDCHYAKREIRRSFIARATAGFPRDLDLSDFPHPRV